MLPAWAQVTALTLIAGAAIPLGGFVARIEKLRPQWLEKELRHSVIAFGGGALLSAVALVLVPEGIKALPMWAVALAFSAGGGAMLVLERFLATRGTQAGQLTAMVCDFIPEAIALGALSAPGGGTVYLLALLIAMQNLPEGFNAYREMRGQKGFSAKKVLTAFCLLALLGPAAGLLGLYLLGSLPTVVGALMLFASGGILYLVFQDIAPQAKLERRWAPPLGAVAGFLLGMVGHMLIHAG